MASVKNQWTLRKLPPVVVVSGNDTFMARLEVAKARKTLMGRGYRFLRLPGEDHSALEGLTAPQGFMSLGKVLAVVTSPEKTSPEVVLRHWENGDPDTLLLLHQEGAVSRKKTPLKDLLERLPNNVHARFSLPKPWEAPKRAVKYLEKLAQEEGVSLAPGVASGLVQVQGTNLGFLHFELWKAIILARSEGVDEVGGSHLKRVVSPISKASVEPVVQALARKDPMRLLRGLGRLRETHPTEPTMLVCTWVGNAATRWLHAASLKNLGGSDEDVASLMGVHVFVYRKEILPVVRVWGVLPLKKLLHRLTIVTRAVRQGRLSPWVLLEAQLVVACR